MDIEFLNREHLKEKDLSSAYCIETSYAEIPMIGVAIDTTILSLGFNYENLFLNTLDTIKRYQYLDVVKPQHIEFTDLLKNFRASAYGTAYQLDVWRSLSNIPNGQTFSYLDFARTMNKATSLCAVRAVANAIGKNPLCVFIPCHRIIHHNGDIGKFRFGSDIKERLLSFEKKTIA
jgi:methylated-DNA-[protein]-cysteine S-methyltransferase